MSEEDYYPDIDALYEERTEVPDHLNDWYDTIEDDINTYYEDDSDEDSSCL